LTEKGVDFIKSSVFGRLLGILILSTVLCLVYTSAVFAVEDGGNLDSGEHFEVEGDSFSNISDVVEEIEKESVNTQPKIIELGNKTYYGDNKVIDVNSNNLTFRGQSNENRAVLDARGLSGIFNIMGFNVTFANVNFVNGNSTYDSVGALSVFGNVFLENCSFINCGGKGFAAVNILKTNEYSGWFLDSEISYSNFSNNKGSAIKSYYPVNVLYSNFVNNGNSAMVLYSDNNYISDCVFRNNNASSSNGVGDGGGIFFENSMASNVMNSIFEGNSARNGGAVFVKNSVVTIRDSSFLNNVASSNGGAVFSSSNLDIYNSNFANNRASSKLVISVPRYVNCSNVATISVSLTGGNNVLNAIYNSGVLKVDGKTPKQSNKVSGQNIKLTVNKLRYSSKTNSNGGAVFKINTGKFAIKSHEVVATFLKTSLYSQSSTRSFLKVTNKKVVVTSILKARTYKKVVKVYAKITVNKYKKVLAKISTNYYSIKNGKYALFKKKSVKNWVNRLVARSTKWVLINNKNKKKYRWNEQKRVTYYLKKGTKVTQTFLNGKRIAKKINKKYLFKTSVSKRIRSDWTKYLASSTDCNKNNPKIKRVVKKIISSINPSKRTDKAIANGIWDWIKKNIKYDNAVYGGTRFGSDGTLDRKNGNCLDNTHLAVAMFRAANIPAIYVYKANVYGGAHVWTKVYINKRWVHADTSLKSGSLRGQSKWIKAKVFNNDPDNSFVTHDYINHKHLKINGVWYSVSKSIEYSDGTMKTVYKLFKAL
jgi:hypothetical protein